MLKTSHFSCLGPISGGVVTLKTGRRKVPGSIPGRACRPSRSEFSVVFSETRVNTGQDPLERRLRRALHLQIQIPREIIGLNTNNHHFFVLFCLSSTFCVTANIGKCSPINVLFIGSYVFSPQIEGTFISRGAYPLSLRIEPDQKTLKILEQSDVLLAHFFGFTWP